MKTTEIISKLRDKDDRMVDQAFAYLYKDYFPVINAFIRNNSGTEEDAADVFQDALIVLYNKIREEHFQLTCAIKTFIYSICKNLWLKKMTMRKQDLLKKEAFRVVDLEPNVMDILEEDEQSLLVAQLLKKIGGDAERLLTYFYFDGMKTEEVTYKMGYANEQVTRNKKSRCLKKLRALLANINIT